MRDLTLMERAKLFILSVREFRAVGRAIVRRRLPQRAGDERRIADGAAPASLARQRAAVAGRTP